MTAQIRLLIDNLHNAERAPVIPKISAYRGASRSDIEHTAFEIERLFILAVASARALIDNLNENLPAGELVNADSFLTDTVNGAADLVSDVRGKADRLDDLREHDR
jgi:hypothetical protein